MYLDKKALRLVIAEGAVFVLLWIAAIAAGMVYSYNGKDGMSFFFVSVIIAGFGAISVRNRFYKAGLKIFTDSVYYDIQTACDPEKYIKLFHDAANDTSYVYAKPSLFSVAYLASAYHLAGDDEKAKEWLANAEALAKRKNDRVILEVIKAKLCYGSGDVAGGDAILAQVESQKPGGRITVYLGELRSGLRAYAVGEYDTLEKSARAQLDPGKMPPLTNLEKANEHFYLASALEHRGCIDEAKEHYTEAARLGNRTIFGTRSQERLQNL
ncbi:MAG: hypothetical protein J5793_01800 [Clostridia bacterium]|nr:hypothetical protein [Clostridia bacterium]